MANPRLPILTQMETALQAVTTANYSIPRSIRLVTRRGKQIDQVKPEEKPAVVILSEENDSEFVGTGGVKRTTMTVAFVVYDIIRNGEEPAEVLDQYADAIIEVLHEHRYWNGLADTTRIGGVAQHEIMEALLPDVKTTVAALIDYTWVHDAA